MPRRLTLAVLHVVRAAATLTALTIAALTITGPRRWLTTDALALAVAASIAYTADLALTRTRNRDRYRQERDWSKR